MICNKDGNYWSFLSCGRRSRSRCISPCTAQTMRNRIEPYTNQCQAMESACRTIVAYRLVADFEEKLLDFHARDGICRVLFIKVRLDNCSIWSNRHPFLSLGLTTAKMTRSPQNQSHSTWSFSNLPARSKGAPNDSPFRSTTKDDPIPAKVNLQPKPGI